MALLKCMKLLVAFGILLQHYSELAFGSINSDDGGDNNTNMMNTMAPMKNNSDTDTGTTVNITYECLKDVERLYYKISGFYECEVEWNIKVSFDMSLQLEEYCHSHSDLSGSSSVGDGVEAASDGDDDSNDDNTTTDEENPTPPPPDCLVEYNRLECYFDFWDKCHMAGGRTITQDVNYDCFDNGLQFGLTLIGKVDCVPDSCLTKNLFPHIAPAFASISNCKIKATDNIKVDEIDHNATPKKNNKIINNNDNTSTGTFQNDGSSKNDQLHETKEGDGNGNDFDELEFSTSNESKSSSNHGIYDYSSLLYVVAIAILASITIIFCASTSCVSRMVRRSSTDDAVDVATNIEDEEERTSTMQEENQALQPQEGVSYGSCD